MITSLILMIALAAPQCKVVWRDSGNNKRYESKAMDCPEAKKRRDWIAERKPGLEVWVELAPKRGRSK
jgi:hypothetical protein